jgi:hypothetical protein
VGTAGSDAFGALKLTETARGVLKDETEVMLGEAADPRIETSPRHGQFAGTSFESRCCAR